MEKKWVEKALELLKGGQLDSQVQLVLVGLLKHLKAKDKIQELALKLNKAMLTSSYKDFLTQALKVVIELVDVDYALLYLRSKKEESFDFHPEGRWMYPVLWELKRGDDEAEVEIIKKVMEEPVDTEIKWPHPFHKSIELKEIIVYTEEKDEELYRRGIIEKPKLYERARKYIAENWGIDPNKIKKFQEIDIPIIVNGKVIGVLTCSTIFSNKQIEESFIKHLDQVASFIGEAIQGAFSYYQYKTLLSKTMSKRVLEKILEDPEKYLDRGIEKVITCAFADIEAYSAYAQRESLSKILRDLRKVFDLVSEKTKTYGGVIGYYQGDAVLFFFNAPEDQPDHALNAVKCSQHLRDELKKRNLEFRLNIGITTGKAILGNAGSKDHICYTAIGHPINVASRLADLARGGQILISDSTYQLVKEKVKAKWLGNFSLKNVLSPVQVYEVL